MLRPSPAGFEAICSSEVRGGNINAEPAQLPLIFHRFLQRTSAALLPCFLVRPGFRPTTRNRPTLPSPAKLRYASKLGHWLSEAPNRDQ